MNWFRQNPWLGRFVIIFGVCLLGAAFFLFHSKGSYDDALARFNDAAAERSRLERLDPFPSEANYKKMKIFVDNYAAALDKFKAELKTKMFPAPPLAPNEFQSHLRQAMLTTADKARASKVALPENFALGFEEYTASLPNSPETAALLGQELTQVEALMNILVDAHIDGVTAFSRTPSTEEHAAGAAAPAPGGRKPPAPVATGPKMLERTVVEVTFSSIPSAARKVLNQIASSSQQFYIVRVLNVHNEKDKGPAREDKSQAAAGGAAAPTPTPNPAPGAKGAAAPALTFIVGNEHIETSARIELIRFTY